LFVGPHPAEDKDTFDLKKLGVDAVLNLMTETDNLYRYVENGILSKQFRNKGIR
jgi:hypothetical protein